MASLIDEDDALDHFVMSKWERIDLVNRSLISLLASYDGQGVAAARPETYNTLVSRLHAYDEYVTEQMELQAEWRGRAEKRPPRAIKQQKGSALAGR